MIQSPLRRAARPHTRPGTARARISTGIAAALLLTALGGGAAAATPLPTPDEAAPAIRTVQVLAINDFHGRIEAAPSSNVAGAAVLAGAVAQLRAAHPDTIFASAGDNIGASTFTSFISRDEPTLDALVTAGLEVSAVGNHEFDHGITDLRDRVLPRYGATDPALSHALGLGANVVDAATGAPLLPEYAIVERDGIRIGFIGTVTEQTATSVNPALIEGVAFESQLEAANRVAAAIDDQVDATVLLAHDGAQSADCSAIAQEQSGFGTLAREVSPLVDAVVSAHTHQAYACEIDGRPVVQSGFYGGALSRLSLEFTEVSGTAVFTGATADLVPLVADGAPQFPADPAVEAIVAAAQQTAEVEGSRPVGTISGPIVRGGTPPGSDRGVESSLGNLIADITLDAIPGADIGLMNAGGLREDLLYREAGDQGLPEGSPAGTVSYRDVANVQPFANTMMTVQLTGAQLKRVLEQQWSGEPGAETKRFLSVSRGFSYTYLPDRAAGERITSMTLNGDPVAPDATFTVATIAFLANGGDNLSVLAEGTDRTDTGRNDLQITIEHFAAHEVVDPPAIGRAVVGDAPGPTPTPEPDPPPGTDAEGNTAGAGHDGNTDENTGAAAGEGAGEGAASALAQTGASASTGVWWVALLTGGLGLALWGANARRASSQRG